MHSRCCECSDTRSNYEFSRVSKTKGGRTRSNVVVSFRTLYLQRIATKLVPRDYSGSIKYSSSLQQSCISSSNIANRKHQRVAMAATFSDAASSAKQLLSSVQVTLRAKPNPSSCSADNSGNPDTSEANRHGSVIFRVADEDSSMINMIDMNGETFTFDNVKWADESQEQVYKAAAHPFVEESLRGCNATILAYGPARTGKSYTMGTLMDKDCQANGLIQRSLERIFQQPEIRVSASVVEIYSEEVYDLLNHGVELTVCDGKAIDARIKSIKSLERGFHLVKRALHLRREHPTSGSQSHVVLTLHLKIKNGQNYSESRLNLIDLAGSRVIQQLTGVGSKDLSERCCFEESLSALARVIVKKSNSLKDLFSKKSTLTSVLKDSLNANCLISLIACVSLEADDHKENLRTLLLADVARSMKIEPESGATSGSVESELNSPSEKLGSVSPAGSEQTEEIVTKKTVELSTKPNVKNCIVVLKQCEVDSHERDKEPQKCEESEEPNDETTRTPPGTNSTVSISRLETPNPENKNHQRINTDEHTWTCFDDSCSISPVAVNGSEQLYKLGEEEPSLEYYLECSCPCQCEVPGSPQSGGDQADRSTEEAAENGQLTLADNVSQLSICSGEETEIPVYLCGQGGYSSRSENDTNDDLHQLQRLEMMRRFEVIRRMKRRSGPSLTVDFSEPGPSGASAGPTPSKVQKLEDDGSGSKVHNVQGPCKPDKSGSEDEKDCVDDGKDVKNVLNEKQKAQNESILKVLNSCAVKHLQMLPRIGAKTAMSIYQYRLIHGDFKSLKDLKNLPIWTPLMFSKFLTANNATLE